MQRDVRNNPWMLYDVPDHFKTHEMCNEAVRREPFTLYYGPYHLKTQEICDKAVEEDLCLLEYVPDWFVTQEQLKLWHGDIYWYKYDDEIIE